MVISFTGGGRVFTKPRAFRRQIIIDSKNIGLKGAPKLVREVRDMFVMKARAKSPRQTGRMRGSIRYQKFGQTGELVSAGYKGRRGLPVGPFTDKKIRYTSTKADNPFFAAGQTFRYGDRVKTPGGNNVKWTGDYKDGWWTSTVKETNRIFKSQIAAKKVLTYSR